MDQPLSPEKENPSADETLGTIQGGPSEPSPDADDRGKTPKSQEKQTTKGDTGESVEFLRQYAPYGPWQIHAFDPDRKTKPITEFFTDYEEAQAFIEKHNGTRNLYFTLNETKPGKDRKKTDITKMRCIAVDLDPPKTSARDLEADRVEILGLLTENLPEGVPEPSIVWDSGGGYWAVWFFENPKATNADVAGIHAEEVEKTIRELERFAIGVEEAFGPPYADNCFNIDRIARLPGTLNIPDAKKREAGRVERMARVVKVTGKTYSLNDFPKGEPRNIGTNAGHSSSSDHQVKVDPSSAKRLESIDKLPRECAPWLGPLIETGINPDDPTKYDGGKDRSGALYATVCELLRAGVDNELIYGIITDKKWKISASVLDKSNVQRYAMRQIQKAHDNTSTPWLKDWNDRYCIIEASGAGCKVYEEKYDPAMHSYRATYHSFEDVKKMNLHRLTEVPKFDKDGKPDGVTFKKKADLWLEHPRANRRELVVFVPGKDLDDDPRFEGRYLNRWCGYTYETVQGDKHQSYLAHLRDNVCCGNDEHYQYLLSWMARAIQQPDKPGEVAIVMRGKKGVGKSFPAKHFGKLFGRHSMTVSNKKHLTGNFNAHLEDKVFFLADEAFFEGDKESEGVLKNLITGDTAAIERKGHDVQEQPNYLHIMMASNEKYVVPATPDERRFLVLDVSDKQMQNEDYFERIAEDLNAGGYENLLWFLQNRDISNFKVRKVPQTDGLLDQQLRGLNPVQKTVYEILKKREVPFGKLVGGDLWLPTTALQKYIAHERKVKDVSADEVTEFLRLPKKTIIKNNAFDSASHGAMNGKERRDKTTYNKSRRAGTLIPAGVKEARIRFEHAVGMKIHWDDDCGEHDTIDVAEYHISERGPWYDMPDEGKDKF